MNQLILIFLAYLGINAASIYLQFIPGIWTMVAWGFLFPIGLIGISWHFVNKFHLEKFGRLFWGGLLTLLSILFGFINYYIIGSMWAAV